MEIEKLKSIFYEYFKKYGYEKTLAHFHNIQTREELIQELAENQEQAYNLNKNYEKALAEIQKIFIYNYKQEQEIKKEIEKMQILNQKFDDKLQKIHDKLSEEENKQKKIKNKYILGSILAIFAGGKIASKTYKKYK